MEKQMHIAIIGCGNMGTGIAQGLSPFHKLALFDRDFPATQELAREIKARACPSAEEAIQEAEIIILAIKPQNLKEISDLIAPHLKTDQIIISLLAGTPHSVLRRYFHSSLIIRMMPNLALTYGEGVIGMVDNPYLTQALKHKLQTLFEPLGMVYWLSESKIDALTSLTGSGPAFIFTLIEAMVEAGMAMGFGAEDAKNLVLQMIKGSLTLLEKTRKHPGELKWQVTSPAGTTIEGLKALEDYAIRSGIIHTFLAAYERSKELSSDH
ncbi:pyrroline-5-carboxylate reductase [Candidatus Protochlamydia phocaeensis]|uniref:pyrroline-5-carboxylate reductase n=1 Tax=Candidatus Protochlamydia phocaeensis TaxID=1414722 RepID=UPI000837DF18|nr:pyrroline-5-carboxylate reductase [Candidatus Protochlamydia phocaeensis]